VKLQACQEKGKESYIQKENYQEGSKEKEEKEEKEFG